MYGGEIEVTDRCRQLVGRDNVGFLIAELRNYKIEEGDSTSHGTLQFRSHIVEWEIEITKTTSRVMRTLVIGTGGFSQ